MLRRVIRAVSGCLLAGALSAPLGPVTTDQAVKSIQGSSTRPLPSVVPAPVVRPDLVWVPDRHVPVPDQPGTILVPGHWERRVSPNEYYVPPLTVIRPDGRAETVPPGIRAPADVRPGP